MSEDNIFETNEELGEFYQRCGEVFLANIGYLIFQCTLCDNKYDSFEDYWKHVMQKHYLNTDENNENKDENNDFAEEADSKAIEIDPDNLLHIDNIIEEACDIASDQEMTKDEEQPEIKFETLLIEPNHNKKTKGKAVPEIPQAEKSLPTCEQCGKTFARKEYVKLHMRRHTGDKRFPCKICPMRFVTEGEVTEHTRRHNNEKNFLCPECGKAFFTSSAMTTHKKRAHHKLIRNFECSICTKRFFDRRALQDHFVSHTKEAPYECPTCHVRFPRSKSLTEHKKIHANKRSYVCKLCEARFNQCAGLYSHMKTKHNSA